MGTHLGRRHRNIVKTACGVMIDFRAVALAKRTGRMPYIDVDAASTTPAWMIAAIDNICPKCLAQTEGWDMLAEASRARLRNVQTVHIQFEIVGAEAVRMCCDKMWAIESLFKNDIGYISPSQLASYLADDKLHNSILCKKCLEHPMAQMTFLGQIDL